MLSDRRFGRLAPPDWDHVDKYPMTASHLARVTRPRPVVIGIDWFDSFDTPEWDQSTQAWWIGRDGRLDGRPNGHSVCLKPRGSNDPGSWYDFYDQVDQGICVSEACSRHQSHYNRRAYQPRWLYDQCKKIDGIPNEEGTFVRAGMDVLKRQGHVRRKPAEPHALLKDEITRYPLASEGISAYRWLRGIDDVLEVLGYGDKDYVDILNSWGRWYPHMVRMPASTLERLYFRDGEFAVATDR